MLFTTHAAAFCLKLPPNFPIILQVVMPVRTSTGVCAHTHTSSIPEKQQKREKIKKKLCCGKVAPALRGEANRKVGRKQIKKRLKEGVIEWRGKEREKPYSVLSKRITFNK